LTVWGNDGKVALVRLMNRRNVTYFLATGAALLSIAGILYVVFPSSLEQLTELALPEQSVPNGSRVEGQGVRKIGADAWHQAGVTGAGLRIGILDQGFGGYRDLLGADLPDTVTVATFGWTDDEGEIDHGTACAEIIHDVAPGAELFFARYDGSASALSEAVDWLLAQRIDIISNSGGELIGPRDGSGRSAQLVDDLAEQGILWVNAAGNEALGHYRGAFADTDGDGFHEFAPGDEMLALRNKGSVRVALTWEDDWEQAAQDYDLWLYDADGKKLTAARDTQAGDAGQKPVEWIEYETGGETVFAVVRAYSVDRVVTLDIFAYDAEVDTRSPGHSIRPPGDAVGALTVGAVNWWTETLAGYSSRGPTNDGRLKPELTAPAGVSGFTRGDEGFNGTSAAAAHAAGAVALVWQAYPEFTRQEVINFLLKHAIDLGLSGPDTSYGYGRLQLPAPPFGEIE
jgi:subtilisin family serine protease